MGLIGVNIDADIATIERCLAICGIGYMNAPTHRAAMRHVMPARVELGVRTIFNILGPLTNPAGPWRKPTERSAWRRLGWCMVMDGTDEISIAAPTVDGDTMVVGL